MAISTINLGILAHVDAGKTTLTERILFETGIIRSIGRVDKGTTQTDTLDLERTRGITIKAAIVSFLLDGLTVNLIDTPGHADFIAEVERSLRVLDAVVLVVSAVEGVQPQTRRLARAVRAAGLPLLIFVNKIDRLGARGDVLLDDMRRRLTLRAVAMNGAADIGSRAAQIVIWPRDDPAWRERLTDLLAETNEEVIAAYDLAGRAPSADFLEAELRAQVAAGTVVPVYFGSAVTGAGVPELLAGIGAWLPPAAADADAPLDAAIFNIARRPSGEKLAYARLFAGQVAVRQRVALQRRDGLTEMAPIEERITGIERFATGTAIAAAAASAGQIVALHGLHAARIGDRLGGERSIAEMAPAFAAPALESVIRPVDPGQITRLRAALEALAEQDPLISLRQRNEAGELSLRLYGEVQKEVIAETLAGEYGIAVTFGPTRPICIESPTGAGEHVEIIGTPGNPFAATVGFRIEPGGHGSGVCYRRDLGALPPAFYRAIEETIHEALTQGLYGWEVTDIAVTLTAAGYWSPVSTAGDFRKLTPFVLLQALHAAGTEVCEPVERLDLEIPEETFGAVCGALVTARATMRETVLEGAAYHVICDIPTAELRAVEQHLPRLTRGEGDWLSSFAGYIPVHGDPPTRERIGPNPLNRTMYLAEVARG